MTDTVYDATHLLGEEGSAKVTAAEIGLEGWRIAGWRTWGPTYGHALEFAVQEMTKAMEKGVDDITHEFTPANPLAALDRLVYDLFTIAVEGLPSVAEMPPVVEYEWPGKKPPTREQKLVRMLHQFLIENDEARLTKDGVAIVANPEVGVYSYSSDAMTRAIPRIEEAVGHQESAV